jgi:hypothetical protein
MPHHHGNFSAAAVLTSVEHTTIGSKQIPRSQGIHPSNGAEESPLNMLDRLMSKKLAAW